MKQDFSEAMSKRTNEELIEIVKVKRDDYQPEAVETAEKELESRQVNPDQIEQVKRELTEKEIKKKEFDSSKVTSWTRLIHFVVDLFCFVLIALILGLIAGLFISSPSETILELLDSILLIVSFFLYFVFMEYKFQRTIGKFLTKTKVVMSDGSKPLLNEIFIRTICRLIPFDHFSYLFTPNGFHDRLSNTTVVKVKKEKS